eukprot:TRINITY_DN9573_c0_g1_i1.p1 TRINITY_DN9573_c0_g1~~TRINITY_DN9573_c0_g1_i1.p1  ORF type:complete len:316 (+),score=-46.92 TRINITY_DN9573_c0_g1_i1:534-1481(+)
MHAGVRRLVQETQLTVDHLVFPLFLQTGQKIQTPIPAMPGHYRWSIDQLDRLLDQVLAQKIPAVLLFGIPEEKDLIGSQAYQEEGVVQKALRYLKQHYPQLLLIADLCFCEYTSHGHCGVLDNKQQVDNDSTLALLAQQALSLARAGADVVAPSGMIDGMVRAIRTALNAAHFEHTLILSYAAKFASAFYGPFRAAVDSTPSFGNRLEYQLDPANGRQALREIALDIQEGADMIMVKPALPYLDVIQKIHHTFPDAPLCAYQVSGEYSMIHAAGQKGWLDPSAALLESLISIKRAGAQFIISYAALEIATLLAAA